MATVLTSPSEPAGNDGHDNANSDLILRAGMVLEDSDTEIRYVVKEMLGQGTFGQVVKCSREGGEEDYNNPRRNEGASTSSSNSNSNSNSRNSHVAVKVIKNQPAYYHQALVEISVLKLLNDQHDPHDTRHIVRLIDHFVHKKHLCIVFELLTYNLFELIRQNQFRGLSLKLVRLFTKQLLDALVVLRQARVIHCDLKPENVLLKSLNGDIKLIDFGSACLENRIVYSYIQSRFYRSPEVILGHHYTSAIDMWSLGCVAAELFLGLPLFPGASEFDLLHRMVEALGSQPPDRVLRSAKNTAKYFKHCPRPPSKHPPPPVPKALPGKGALGATLCSATGPLSPVSENSSTKGFTLSGADDICGISPAQSQDGIPQEQEARTGESLPASGIPIGSRHRQQTETGATHNKVVLPGGGSTALVNVDFTLEGADDAASTLANTSSASSSFDSFGHFTSSSATSPSSLFSSASSRSASPASTAEYALLSAEEYAERERVKPAMGKRYFKERNLHELILTYNGINAATGIVTGAAMGGPLASARPEASSLEEEFQSGGRDLSQGVARGQGAGVAPKVTSGLTACITQAERVERLVFADFLRGLIEMDPEKRWTPQQAVLHPFITEIPGPLPFVPPPIPPSTVEARKGTSAPGPSGLFSGPASLPSLFAPHLSSLPSRGIYTQGQQGQAQSQGHADSAGGNPQYQHGNAPLLAPIAGQVSAFHARYGFSQSGPSSLPQPLTAQWYAGGYQPVMGHQGPLYYSPHVGYDSGVHNRSEAGVGSYGSYGTPTSRGHQGPGSMDRGSWGGGVQVVFNPGSAPGIPPPVYLQQGMGVALGPVYPTPLDLPITSGPRLSFAQHSSYSSGAGTPDGVPLAYHASDPCAGQAQEVSPSGLPIPSRLRSMSSQSGQQHFSPAMASPMQVPAVLMHNAVLGGAQPFYPNVTQSPGSMEGAFLPGSMDSSAGVPGPALVNSSLHGFVPQSPGSYGDGVHLPHSLGSTLGMSSVAQGVPLMGSSGRDAMGTYPHLPSSLGSSVGGMDSRNNSQRLTPGEYGEGATSAEPSPSPPTSTLEASLSAGERLGQRNSDGGGFTRQGGVGDAQRNMPGRLAGIPEAAGGAYVVVHGGGGWPHGYPTPGSAPGAPLHFVGVRPGSYPEGGQVVYHQQYVSSPAATWHQMGSYSAVQDLRGQSMTGGVGPMRGSGPGRPPQSASYQGGGVWPAERADGGPEGRGFQEEQVLQRSGEGEESRYEEWEDEQPGVPSEPEDWDPYFADDLVLQDGSRNGSAGGGDVSNSSRGRVSSYHSPAEGNTSQGEGYQARYGPQGHAALHVQGGYGFQQQVGYASRGAGYGSSSVQGMGQFTPRAGMHSGMHREHGGSTGAGGFGGDGSLSSSFRSMNLGGQVNREQGEGSTQK